MITRDNEPIMLMSDGGYIVQHGSYRYVVRDSDERGIYKTAEIEMYLAEHPEALIPEPLPPEPTAEELAAQRRASIIAELNALDASAVRYLRATMENTIDKEGTKRYEANTKRVKELKAELQTLSQE